MARAIPQKLYCNMHDVCINANSRKVEQMIEAEIQCVCCGRYYSGNNAFTLAHKGETHPCNCFFGTIENGSYTKDEIEKHLIFRGNGYGTLAETVEDREDSDRESREEDNANGCELHIDCEDPKCNGRSLSVISEELRREQEAKAQ